MKKIIGIIIIAIAVALSGVKIYQMNASKETAKKNNLATENATEKNESENELQNIAMAENYVSKNTSNGVTVSESRELTKENFDDAIKRNDKIVIVDFYATWCGPCKKLSPIIEEVAEENSDSIELYKVDTDKEQELAERYGIQYLPTVVYFKDGEIVKTTVGLQTKEQIEDVINSI